MKEAEIFLTENDAAGSHWGQRIIAAERRGNFTEKDKRAAGTWVTCACGKQDKRIPRRPGGRGRPADEVLSALGDGFYLLVCADRHLGAAETLLKIEARADEILDEMGS